MSQSSTLTTTPWRLPLVRNSQLLYWRGKRLLKNLSWHKITRTKTHRENRTRYTNNLSSENGRLIIVLFQTPYLSWFCFCLIVVFVLFCFVLFYFDFICFVFLFVWLVGWLVGWFVFFFFFWFYFLFVFLYLFFAAIMTIYEFLAPSYNSKWPQISSTIQASVSVGVVENSNYTPAEE